jgi:flagellar biosynthetic protein FliQ
VQTETAKGSGVTDTTVVHLGMQAMMIAVKLGTPVLLTALVIGFAISLFQSATQIQEQTLSFVPKVIGVGVALLVSGNWMLHEMVAFTTGLYGQIPHLINAV